MARQARAVAPSTSTSTACGSTRCRPSSTHAPTSCPSWPSRVDELGTRLGVPYATSPRAPTTTLRWSRPGPPAAGHGRPVERRLPPRAARRPDRRADGLLPGLRPARRPGPGDERRVRPQGECSAFRAGATGPRRGPGARALRAASPRTTTRSATGPRDQRLPMLWPPDRQRLAAALVLLAPGVPLLFMGEEYGETRPSPSSSTTATRSSSRRGGVGGPTSSGPAGSSCRSTRPTRRPSGPPSSTGTPGASPRTSVEMWALHRSADRPATGPSARLRRSRRVDARAQVAGSVLGQADPSRDPAGSVARVVQPRARRGRGDRALDDHRKAVPPGGLVWRRLLDSAEAEFGGKGRSAPTSWRPATRSRWVHGDSSCTGPIPERPVAVR